VAQRALRKLSREGGGVGIDALGGTTTGELSLLSRSLDGALEVSRGHWRLVTL
jgi:hypothetical protein